MAREKKEDVPKEMPGFRIWLEEAWHGWLKSIAGVLLLLAAYLAYNNNLLREANAGLAAVALIVGGSLWSALAPVFGLVEKRFHRLVLGLFAAIWAVTIAYPVLQRAFPSQPLAEPVRVGDCIRYKDNDKRECAEERKEVTAKIDRSTGPFEIVVDGTIAGQGDAEVAYHLDLTGADNSEDHLDGMLSRAMWHQRTSRRGTGGRMVQSEHTEESHRLTVHGSSIKIAADVPSDHLEHGLAITFRSSGIDPRLFFGLALLCMILGVVLDYRFADSKVKTYLGLTGGFLAVFAWRFHEVATPHNLVRMAVEAALVALPGLVIGWLASVIAKSFRPKTKRITR